MTRSIAESPRMISIELLDTSGEGELRIAIGDGRWVALYSYYLATISPILFPTYLYKYKVGNCTNLGGTNLAA